MRRMKQRGEYEPVRFVRTYWLVQVNKNKPMRFDNEAEALSEYSYHLAHVGKTIVSCSIEKREEEV